MNASREWTSDMGRLPSLFISHGSPTFAIDPGVAGPALNALGQRLPRPRAVLIVSAHWLTGNGVRVSTAAQPETIHDFGGFPAVMYTLQYPAPGAPEIAQRTAQVLSDGGWNVQTQDNRGLDHGAWVPLMHLLPDADVPVFQVSMPMRTDGAQAYALGQALAPLADEGVLIIGSGSLTHNLYEVQWDGGDHAEPYALEFSRWVRAAVEGRAHGPLVRTMEEAPHARRAHPTPEHLWPLMVAAGVAGDQVPGQVVDGGVTHGVLSMDAFLFGTIPEPAELAVA